LYYGEIIITRVQTYKENSDKLGITDSSGALSVLLSLNSSSQIPSVAGVDSSTQASAHFHLTTSHPIHDRFIPGILQDLGCYSQSIQIGTRMNTPKDNLQLMGERSMNGYRGNDPKNIFNRDNNLPDPTGKTWCTN
jgi:hypothetical protein